MKCLCGYIYNEEWEIKRDCNWDETSFEYARLKAQNGTTPFLQIEGAFHAVDEYNDIERVSLYACPVCCTMKIVEE